MTDVPLVGYRRTTVVTGVAVSSTGVAMRGWTQLGLGAGALTLIGAAVVASIALGLLEPATDRSPALEVVAVAAPTAGSSASPSASRAPVRDDVGRWPNVTRTAAQLRSGSADLYLPLAGSRGRGDQRFPLVLLVADPAVDPGQYEQLAHDLGTYGLAVVVSSRPTTRALRDVRAWARSVQADPRDYVHDKVSGSVRDVVVVGGAGAVPATESRTLRAELRLAPSDPLVLTDEGRRGPRSGTVVDVRRLPAISAYARSAALWLSAHRDQADAATARTTIRDVLVQSEKTLSP